MSEPTSKPTPLSYEEILRSIGAWIDVRGYHEVRIEGDADCLTIEGVLDHGDERERLLLDSERLQRFCDAARLNRSPAPTVSPSSRPHLTIVPYVRPQAKSAEPDEANA